MAEYIELTEELILSMRAGARAISNTERYHGRIYVANVLSENPKEMPYLKAAEILYAASEKKSADVAPMRHGRWECGKPCPVCGEDRFKGLDADIRADWEPPYCPNCGAKMDGE